MPLRPPAGFIRPGYDPLKVPDAPTGASASAGDASASVSFTPPTNVGGSAISAYYAVSNPDQITGTAASSPVSVTGLTNDTAYTFTVWALNTYGPSPYSAASGSVTPLASIGLFGGGSTTVNINIIDKITISTTGNSTNFGTLTLSRTRLAACASSARGVFCGGYDVVTPFPVYNTIDYVTFASGGNAADFGDLLSNYEGSAGCSNSTRGLVGGGYNNTTASNVIQYITIAAAGNATDFGDLTWSSQGGLGACSSSTRGIFAGGGSGGAYITTINYVTIASAGNATFFGNLLSPPVTGLSGLSSSTRGVFGGGNVFPDYSNVIQYITIASTGNAIDFGDLTALKAFTGACSSLTRGVWAGGRSAGGSFNVIEYITIASTGNATDFGDLTLARSGLAGCSNVHGGL